MKSTKMQALSIRAKLKDATTVELVIINHDTGEMQIEYVPLVIGTCILNGRPRTHEVYKQGKKILDTTAELVDGEVIDHECTK